jgi:hypothetical protein
MIVKSFILNPVRMHLLSRKASSHQEEPRQDAFQLSSCTNRCIWSRRKLHTYASNHSKLHKDASEGKESYLSNKEAQSSL